MSTPHKHRDLIVAWANGAEIQFEAPAHNYPEWGREKETVWVDIKNPTWDLTKSYRIKPKPPVVRFAVPMLGHLSHWSIEKWDNHTAKATFDPETGELLTIEKL